MKPQPYLSIKPYGELLTLLVADANREAHELNMGFEVYEEGPDYIRVRAWPDDAPEEYSVVALVRLVGMNPLVEGEPLLAVSFVDDEDPMVICARGKVLFDVLYC